MSVHKLKDGRWIVKSYPGGKERREYFGRGPEAEHAAKDRNIELGLGQRKRRKPTSATFKDLALKYLEAKKNHKSASDWKATAYKLKGKIFPEIGQGAAIRLTFHRIDQYVDKRMKTVKAVTVCRDIDIIQAVLRWAVRHRKLSRNPLEGYRKPKRDDAIIQPPTVAEMKMIYHYAPDHLKRALAISYYTGLRPGRAELFRLRYSDIDFELGVITVIGARKGGPVKRNIPLHDEFLQLLKQWRKVDGHDDYIILFNGEPINRIKRSWDTAKRNAGITRRIRPYDMRHAFASRLLAGNADLKATSELLGHSRPDTTLRIYQHTTTALHRAAINKLPGLVTKDSDQYIEE
jgi:integrase